MPFTGCLRTSRVLRLSLLFISQDTKSLPCFTMYYCWAKAAGLCTLVRVAGRWSIRLLILPSAILLLVEIFRIFRFRVPAAGQPAGFLPWCYQWWSSARGIPRLHTAWFVRFVGTKQEKVSVHHCDQSFLRPALVLKQVTRSKALMSSMVKE